MPTINGTEGDDALAGTTGDDTINVLGGNDTVFASTGNDTVNGGTGNDYLQGQDGNDTINGDDGDDQLYGGLGSDIVNGGAGNDTLIVLNSWPDGMELTSGDQMFGGDGYDTASFQGGSEYFDITAITFGSDIEAIYSTMWVRLNFSQMSQFSSMQGYYDLVGSGTLDLTGNRFMSGILSLGSGNDNVTMAGNTPTSSVTVWGKGGDDVIIGTENGDSIDGGDGNDTIEGRGGADQLLGGAGNDTMLGGDGNDTFHKGFGTDIMDGGAGDDLFMVSIAEGFDADDQVIGGAGVDTLNIESSGIYQGWQDFSQYDITGIERFEGGNASFIMSVAELAQFQYFQVGSLQLSSAGTVTYGSSFKVNDFFLSSFGNTVDLSASTDQTRVIGGAGNDTVTGSGGTDELRGGGGNDTLNGGGGSDELMGGEGVDWLNGGSGNDYLYVGIGETISAGDRFTGGSGTDTLLVGYDPDQGWDPAAPIIDLSLATIDAGIETLQGNSIRLNVGQVGSFGLISVQSLYLANGGAVDFSNVAFSGNIYLSDLGNHVTASNVISNYGINAFGGAGNDTVIGSAQGVHDELRGGGGNDTLFGGGGDDFLDGGTGADAMDGGTGNDGYMVDNVGDTVSEATGNGNDSVTSSVSFTLGAGIEDLGLSGTDSINATGNAQDNHLGGNSGNNILDGGAGADTMVGGNGNDTYIVDNSNDYVDEWGYDGVDLVNSSASFILPFFVENLTLTGTAAINGTGSDFANVIQGNSNANILSGEVGADTLSGGDGNDTLFGGTDNDSLNGDGGDDSLDGGDGNDNLSGGTGTDTAAYGTASAGVAVSLAIAGAQNTVSAGSDTLTSIENLSGSQYGDTLTGSVGANVLNGQGGNDTLDGGAGDDTLNGGTGTDNASYAAAAGAVTVSLALSGAQNTGAAGNDTLANIENLVGSGFADTLTGNSGNNSLLGAAGNDTLDGGDGADYLDGGTGNDTMNGGAGIDTASYAGSAAGVTVNLATLTAQNTVGAGSDTLNNIENLIGSVLADTLTGDSNANLLEGGAGNDLLNGGAGTDTASYWTALSGVTVNLGLATAQNTVGAGTDTLSNFENLLGSSFNDTLTGNSGDNSIEGAGGNDTLNGGTGNDTASYSTAWSGVVVNLSLAGAQDTGGAGTDTLSNFENLTGSVFADTLTGNAGDNVLNGFGGDDSFDGGTGTDTVTYAGSWSPVFVSLALGGVQSTGYGNHTLANIENLIGSASSDTLEGNGSANLLDGGDGIDIVSYANAASGVTVSLAIAGAQNTVGAGTDTLVNMEWLTGSAFNDTLTGNASGQNIVGGAGDDVVTGGAGADWLAGGSGNDSFKDTASGLTGDTITDFAAGDKIVITDATLDGFTFDLSGNASGGTLTFNGNWMSLQGSLNGTLVASAAEGGGVELTMVLATAGNDFIIGTEQADQIDGLGGNDDINGLGGNDQLYGNDGDDTLSGGEGDNFLDGGAGNDSLGDGTGNSNLVGGDGDDWLAGGSGNDVLGGGAGNDTLNGGNDTDSLTGGSGNDSFEGLKTSLNGDTITDFTAGDRILISDATLAGFTFNLNGNTLTYTGGSMTLQGPLTGQLVASAAAGGGVQLSLQAATEGNDTLTGTEQPDFLDGLAGNDTVNGLGGNDLLVGGDGADQVNGGDGDDQIGGGHFTGDYYYNGIAQDNALDHDVLSAGDGNDYIWAGYGDDVDGGAGTDALLYSFGGLAAGITFNTADLISGQPKQFAGGTIQNIEHLIRVEGTQFADTITVATQNAYLDVVAGSGDDLIIAQDSFVSALGGEGNDRFVSGSAADEFYGGAGIDTIDYQNATSGVTVTLGNPEGSGSGAGGDSLDSVENAFGSGFADNLAGGSGSNLLKGMAGNDILIGNGGDDFLEGGAGDDTIDGGTGIDAASYADAAGGVTVNLTLAGSQNTIGAGSDTLSNIENLTGSAFADTLTGNAAANVLEGGAGNDVIDGGDSFDTASYAGASAGVNVNLALFGGQDTLGAGTDALSNIENVRGSGFNDTLIGNAGANVIDGGSGNDILNGGAGADVMVGGLGDDRFYIADAGDVVTELANEGDDWAFVLGTYTLEQGVAIETLVALNQSSTDPLVLTGNEFGQSLYGNLGDNYLNGGQGVDYLVGLDGNDNLLGGTGADHLEGGTGNDVYYVDQAGDVIFEASGEGDNDLVVATASYALNSGASIETLSAEQTSANINLTGNEFGQSLYGNSGDNILTGLGGSDYLVGGAGNDKYYVDTSDFIGEDLGGGDDWIFVADSYILREGNEIETLVAVNQASTDPVNLTGNEYGQSLYGSQGVNSLNGGAGNDYLVGLGGNDFLLGGAGNDNLAGGTGNDIYYVDGGDQVIEAASEGDDVVVAFQSFALGAGQSVETLSAAEGSGAIALTGNTLAQSLYGNDGANVLTTGGGADYLVGGSGNDSFIISNAPGVATIADYAGGEVVDISQVLSVANGTNLIAGGYLKVTSGGLLQVDVSGGANSWVTIANVSGSGNVTIRYLSGGSATDLSVARVASQSSADAKTSASDDGSASIAATGDGQAGIDNFEAPDPVLDAPDDAWHGFATFASIDDAFAIHLDTPALV